MALPPSFVDLNAAFNSAPDTSVNIIGVVVDYMPLKSTARGEYMLTFKLLDPHLRDSVWESKGLPRTIFQA